MGEKLKVLDLFSGIGGFALGLERAGGFETVAFCEKEASARKILKEHWPDVPCFEDVRTLTASSLRAAGVADVDVICGGFPCQDASAANVRGKGTKGERTGLFTEITRLAGELGVGLIIMENVANLLGRGFGDVLGALAEVGFDAEWECIPARDVGADHERERLWIVSYPSRSGREGSQPYHGVLVSAKEALAELGDGAFEPWRALVAGERLLRDSDGLSVGLERRRLFHCGNAVVPQIPELIGHAILSALQSQRAAA